MPTVSTRIDMAHVIIYAYISNYFTKAYILHLLTCTLAKNAQLYEPLTDLWKRGGFAQDHYQLHQQQRRQKQPTKPSQAT